MGAINIISETVEDILVRHGFHRDPVEPKNGCLNIGYRGAGRKSLGLHLSVTLEGKLRFEYSGGSTEIRDEAHLCQLMEALRSFQE